jgi:hypothetical protein
MQANDALQERATQDLSCHRQAIEKFLARTKRLFMNHSYK